MNKIVITDEGDLRTVESVADVAEATPGRLQVAYEDETTEIVTGSLFGGRGRWRVWLTAPDSEGLTQQTVEDPLTMPPGFVRMRTDHGYEDRAATIKRLRQPNL